MAAARTLHNWEALGEAVWLFASVISYIWWLGRPYPWMVILLLAVVVATHVVRHESARWLGFGWASFRLALPVIAPWIVASALLVLAAGALAGTIRRLPAEQYFLGITGYLAWGLLQQYLLNAFLLDRLLEFSAGRFAPFAAAALFSLVHLPNWFLMAVTLVLGYVCTRVYLRFRSLYVLGLAHGLVGFCLFLSVPDSISGHFLIGPRYVAQYGAASLHVLR
jgi:hypothetical protein